MIHFTYIHELMMITLISFLNTVNKKYFLNSISQHFREFVLIRSKMKIVIGM